MQEWIDANERKPNLIHERKDCGWQWKESDFVLGVCENGDYVVVQYEEDDIGQFWNDENGENRKITHWMPIPEPPKG